MTALEIKAHLGRKVREIRLNIGWSQWELGFYARLHKNYISSIECGKRDVGLTNLCKLSRALGARVQDLLPEHLEAPSTATETAPTSELPAPGSTRPPRQPRTQAQRVSDGLAAGCSPLLGMGVFPCPGAL